MARTKLSKTSSKNRFIYKFIFVSQEDLCI